MAHNAHTATIMPLLTTPESSTDATPATPTEPSSVQKVTDLPIPTEGLSKKTPATHVVGHVLYEFCLA